MRKFFAVVLGLIGLAFLVSTIVNIFVKDNDVVALADEVDYPVTSVQLPTNIIGLDSDFNLSLDYDFRYNFVTDVNPYPYQDTLSFYFFHGSLQVNQLWVVKFGETAPMTLYNYSNGNYISLRGTPLPFIYVDGQWVRAETVANTYSFDLKYTYMRYYTVGVVDDSTLDLQYYFCHNSYSLSPFENGDCSILIRFSVGSPTSLTLYSFKSQNFNIMMSPPVDSEAFQRGWDEGFEKGEQKGYLDGIEEGFDGDLFGSSIVPSVNSLLSIEILPNISFGRIFSIGWGLLLIGIAIKIFLGG